MNMRAMILAGLLGSTVLSGTALAAESNLALAAKQGDRAAVQSLLKVLEKKDVAGVEGTAALVWAAARNDLQMVDILLRAGADAKTANEYGATALYAAAAHPGAAMTEKLLAAGADANIPLLSGETPLMEAARRGNLATVRALLSANANPNAQDVNGGQNALMWATSERHTAVVEELLRGGADFNAGSKTGFTALMFAAQQGDVDSVRILLRAGAKPNDAQPKSALTPLIIASAMGHVKTVELLLDNGANPNHIDARGYTSLHLVVRDSDYGIDLKGKDNIVRIVRLLLAHKADPNIRFKQERPNAVTVNEVSLDGATPLVLAAEVNNLEAIKAMLEAGADPLIATEHGTTALMLAAGGGTNVQQLRSPEERAVAIDTVKLLVGLGSDVNAAGQYGWTPLHAAAYQGLDDVIEFLVSKGAKIDEMDAFGQTPLSISMAILTRDIGARRPQIPRRYRKETADLILKLGATPLNQSGVDVVLQRTGDLNE